MNVLVLNNDYSPVSITDFKRGFRLVFKGKAEVLEYDATKTIKTERQDYKIPSVIRLLKYVLLPFKKLKPTRENIYRRDGGKCAYCGNSRDLTIDHILPKSKGGLNTWENMVTCCSRCNVIKGDKLLKDTGFKLRVKPFKPNYLYFIKNIGTIQEQWTMYLNIE